MLKLVAAKPDAILIAASGTPAVLPQRTLKERGYAGKYYQTHGVANNDFLRVGGKDVDGTLPAGRPGAGGGAAAAEQPGAGRARSTTSPKYEAANGKGSVSTFGAHAWDAGRLMSAAAAVALKTAQPGTPAFRAALRDALEKVKRAARRARRLQHVADRPPRPRPARPRDGQDRERRLEVPTLKRCCRPEGTPPCGPERSMPRSCKA